MLPIDGIGPYALDDLKDFVPNVELVVELSMSSRVLDFDVELHQRMQQVLGSERHRDE